MLSLYTCGNPRTLITGFSSDGVTGRLERLFHALSTQRPAGFHLRYRFLQKPPTEQPHIRVGSAHQLLSVVSRTRKLRASARTRQVHHFQLSPFEQIIWPLHKSRGTVPHSHPAGHFPVLFELRRNGNHIEGPQNTGCRLEISLLRAFVPVVAKLSRRVPQEDCHVFRRPFGFDGSVFS